MPINVKLLNALLTRDIRTSEFLEISKHLDGVTGEEKRVLQEKLAMKIERDYSLRKNPRSWSGKNDENQ